MIGGESVDKVTEEQIVKDLKSYRTIVDSDDIRIKNIVKNKLQENPYIQYVLNHGKDMDFDEEDDDFNAKNILPYYAVFDTQTEVDNYICIETSYDELMRYNKAFKYQQLIFYVMCHSRSVNDEILGMAKHDLLAALILDTFDYTNFFGSKIHCVSNKPGLVDSRYVSRTLIFENISDNNLARTVEGEPRLINKNRGIVVSDEGIRHKNPK